MENVNSQIIDLMKNGGVSLNAIAVYTKDVPPLTDNLEVIGCYWAQRIAQLNVNIRAHADVCLFLRDTTSELLWLNFFKERVVPLVVEHKLFESWS